MADWDAAQTLEPGFSDPSRKSRLGARVRDLKRMASSGVHWVFASQVVTSAANLATTVLLIRAMGLEAFGQFSICFLLLMAVRSLFHGAILAPSSVVSARLKASSAAAFRGALLLLTLGFAVASCFLLACAVFAVSFLPNAGWITGVMVPLLLANGAACFADLLSRYYVIHDRPKVSFGLECARYSLQMLGLVLLISGIAVKASPATALYALTLGACAAALLGTWGWGSVRYVARMLRALWPRYWKFVRWMSLANLVEAIQTLAPMFIGLALLGEAALGVLRAISQVTNVLNLPTNALQQLLPYRGSQVFKAGGVAGLHRYLSVVSGGVLVFFGAACAVLYAIAQPLGSLLFDEVPNDFALLLMIFVAANLFISLRLVNATAFIVRNSPNQVFYIQAASAVVATGLAFSAALIGPLGIALAIAVSTFVGMLLCFVIRQRSADA